MKIHAIQTGTVAVRPNQREGKGAGLGRLLATLTDPNWTEQMPIWCWVVEHPEGVLVIDTGETARTAEKGYFTPWHPYFGNIHTEVQPEQEVGPQLKKLGLTERDVRWVVMTHLHTDHAGGLHHFPHAEVLIDRRAFALAKGLMGQARGFLPQHWPINFNPRLVDLAPRPWGPFPASLSLTKAEDVILVPTGGHTEGHLSVVLQHESLNYFFAGDTSYTQDLMLQEAIDGVSLNEKSARTTLGRIRRLIESQPTVYLPSHDKNSATRLVERITAW